MSIEMEFDYGATTAAMEKFSQADIDCLRNWTQGLDKAKLVPKDLTDSQLVLFYNACDADLERTKLCIEKYYTCRKNTPEFFVDRNLNSDDLKPSMEALEFSFLPEKSVEGYDIIFHRLHQQEPSKYHLEAGCKLLFMTVDACLCKRGPQPGYVFLFDMRGVKFGHLTRISLSSLRKFFQYIQEAMPVRMRAIHVLNTEPVLDKLLLLIRPFMDKKLFDMIKFHNKNEDLEKFYETVIPRSALPPDYGGSLPDTQTLHRKCMQQLRTLESYWAAEEAQRTAAYLDKKGKDVETTFKRLEID